jgi:hypothetical protein
MASPSIPQSVINGFTKIATLPDESFQELLSTLEKHPLELKQGVVFEDEDLKLEFLSPEESKAIQEALFPVYLGIANGTFPTNAYVDSVAQALKEQASGSVEWAQSEENLEGFKHRLTQLANIESLLLIAKAHNVLTAHSHAYYSARILSDIRPVYGDNVAESPKAAVIVHMLHLVSYQNKARREFVVALDTKDIEDLITILERAKAKTESLESVIASTKLPYIAVK